MDALINNTRPYKVNPALWLLFIMALVVFLSSLYAREITFDDAYFAEQSYWYEKRGYVRSDLFRGVLDWEDRSFVYHKLHVWQGAILIKLAGWQPYLFKALPLIYLIAFISFARFYFKKFITDDKFVFLFFLFLLSIHTFISQYGFEFRPEIMIMSVGFASFLGIRSGLVQNSLALIIFAGIMAGIAALFHLNGLIFIVAGAGLLLLNRAYKELLVFGFASMLAFTPYLIELIPGDNLARFIYEFQNYPVFTKDEHSAWGWLLKFITGPKRFFSHLYEAAFTLLFLFALIINWKEIMRADELKQVLIYLLLLEITLSVISPGAKTMYLSYHIPYMLIVISSTYHSTLQIDRYRNVYFFLLILFVSTQIGHTYSISSKRNIAQLDAHAAIVKNYSISNQHKIIAPEIFVFNEIDNAVIEGLFSANMALAEKKIALTPETLMSYASENNKDFVIIPEKMLKRINDEELRVGMSIYRYQLVGIESGLYIFHNVTS